MADQYDQTPAPVDSTSRGLFGLGGKKTEEVPSKAGEKVHVSEELSTACQEKVEPTEFEQKVQVSQDEPKKESLLHKLHRSDSSSSSSSDEEEVEEGGVKKKKLKEKMKGKDKKTEKDTSVPVEKYEEVPQAEEKKGFMEKMKEKLPGNKKSEEVAPAAAVAPPPVVAAEPTTPTEEKKGFVEKIKEKLPGYHSKTQEEKEKEKNQY